MEVMWWINEYLICCCGIMDHDEVTGLNCVGFDTFQLPSRSLVALSLILSLLLFKPAPLYILDEVDAALDLSHTQNIGQMLRSHFKYSQFIVVSLKDGMFSNANVLFKTKFVDGVSTVARYDKFIALSLSLPYSLSSSIPLLQYKRFFSDTISEKHTALNYPNFPQNTYSITHILV